jgi:APA family basic amino acid/polyamine antiporter
MIGAGILTTSGYILRDTGNPAALLGLWVVGGVMAVCGAMTVAEMATALPRVGGDYIFVREAFGAGTGFVVGWATFVLGFAAPTAIIARTSINYLLAPYANRLANPEPRWDPEILIRLSAASLIAIVTVSHCFGHRRSSQLQVTATVLKLTILLSVAIGGLLFGQGDWGHWSAASWPASHHWPALATGIIYIGYAYSGWNGAGYLAGEIRDPDRLLPKCLIGGATTVVLIYIVVNLVYVFALDPLAMPQRSELEVERVAELAVRHLFGPTAAHVIATLLGVGLVASVSAYILIGPRVAYAMARDGLFPRFAGRLHETRRIPIPATIVQGVVAAALVASGSFLELLDYTSVGLAAISGMVVASVFPLRRRVDLRKPYRLPFFPWPPLFYLGLVGWTIGNAVVNRESRIPALLSLATLAVGIPLSRLLPADQS